MFNITKQLKTERLELRAFKEDDKEAIFNIMKDEEMFLYSNDESWKSIEDAEGFIRLANWLYELDDTVFRHFLAVIIKQTGELIGIAGIGGVEYDRKQNELFYHIGKDNWSKGYATEVAKELLKYAFVDMKLDKIMGIAHIDNNASNRILEKIGLKRKGIIDFVTEEFSCFTGQYLYSLDREEYLKNKVDDKLQEQKEK